MGIHIQAAIGTGSGHVRIAEAEPSHLGSRKILSFDWVHIARIPNDLPRLVLVVLLRPVGASQCAGMSQRVDGDQESAQILVTGFLESHPVDFSRGLALSSVGVRGLGFPVFLREPCLQGPHMRRLERRLFQSSQQRRISPWADIFCHAQSGPENGSRKR